MAVYMILEADVHDPEPMRNINKQRLNTWRAMAANIAFGAARALFSAAIGSPAGW